MFRRKMGWGFIPGGEPGTNEAPKKIDLFKWSQEKFKKLPFLW